MKKKTKAVPVLKTPDSKGTKVKGVIHSQYVQYGISDSMILGTVEALAQVLMSDYYRQYMSDRTGQE